MPYATDADLLARVPAASAASSVARALALADAAAMIDDAQFGGRSVRANVVLAAHYLQLGGLLPGGEGGLVASRAAGAISVSYAVPTWSADVNPGLASTIYGRQYLEIVATLVSVPEVG